MNQDITRQSRQSWWKTDGSTAYYSPFYIDLSDTFNQYSYYGNSYNPDPISNVPHYVIQEIGTASSDWSAYKAKLQQYAGQHYTNTELNSFVAPYDYWFSQNN